jgi:tetratricopeptide (TPR) repeat protein
MSEAWYLLRGRANMKIRNYQAAIEAYEKATELNPENRESMRTLGLAYEKQGLTTKAIEQFDRYLERFRDDPEIAFKQADYLSWERYAYRRDDAIRYYELGLDQQEDRRRRHRLARLLAQDRGRLDAALAQYRILLEAEPDNADWRAEYRDLLLWDPENLAEAVAEYRRLVREKPEDFEARHALARLVVRQEPRSREALTMYADLVSRRPNDPALRLEYARSLARHRDERQAALDQYRSVLAASPAPKTREEYADLLSARAEDRGRALEQYAMLVEARPDDVAVRLKYADLIANERDDLASAIAQYDQVLARDPRNPHAHEGLASSYAWLDDRDRALRHANLAVQHGSQSGRIGDLRTDLRVGREPRIEPELFGLVQRGPSKSKLNGIGFGARAQIDPSPFATLRVRAGFEDYWRSGDDTPGAYLSTGGEIRFDPTQRLNLDIGYHSLGRNASRNMIGRVEYSRNTRSFDFAAGFTRSLRQDSYLALVGDRLAGGRFGAARENRFSGHLGGERGRFDYSLDPYAGWVDAQGVDDNPFVGIRGRGDFAVLDSKRTEMSIGLAADMYHYQDDAFGLDPTQSDPEPGGYFSPAFFFEATPTLGLRLRFGEDGSLDLQGGPALQIVDESGGDTDINVGGHARLSYMLFIRDSIFWSLYTDFTRIGDAYTRVDWHTSVTFKF